MKKLLALILVVGFPGLSPGADDPTDQEIKKLAGEWVGVSFEFNGKRSTMPQIQRRIFAGDEITTMTMSPKFKDKELMKRKYFFRLSPDKEPKEIAFFPIRGTDRPIEHGIYQWEGDMLRICVTGFRNPRPDRFETKSGDNRSLVLLKRVRAVEK